MMPRHASAPDPRLNLARGDLQAANRPMWPEVARPARTGDVWVVLVGMLAALGLGALTMKGLSQGRMASAKTTSAGVDVPAVAASVASSGAALPAATPTVLPKRGGASADRIDPAQSRAMPMVIDNTAAARSDGTAASPPAAKTAGPAAAGLSQDELFAMRVATDRVPVAQVVDLDHTDRMVVQGTVIPAVLETALNTDLPGFVRAIVSRDVRSFDGSWVAIPRGSRLIGQYKSALVTGQSRAYIVWTRLIRPDGASVPLGSPAMDANGEAGLPGEVNRHFWQRFGSSILLSVVSGAASAVGGTSSALIVAGSGAQSASAVALETDGKIPPTIRVPLGTPIQVFTARDLDFSGLQATTSPAPSTGQSQGSAP